MESKLQYFGTGTFVRKYLKARLGPVRTTHSEVPCGTCTACCRSFDQIPLRVSEGDDPCVYRHTFAADGTPIMERNADGSCVYLVEERCSIYARRPHTCRVFDCRILLLMGDDLMTRSLQFTDANPDTHRLLAACWEKFRLVAKAPADRTLQDWFEQRIRDGLVSKRQEKIFDLIEDVLAEYLAIGHQSVQKQSSAS